MTPEQYTRVEGEEHLYRDTNTNAIVNRNIKEYEEFKSKARQKNEINTLREEVSGLKSLLNEVLKKD